MSLSDYNLLPSLMPYIEAGCDRNMLKMSFLAFKANFEHDDVIKIYWAEGKTERTLLFGSFGEKTFLTGYSAQ